MVEEKMSRKILSSAIIILFFLSIIPILAEQEETGKVELTVKVLGYPVAVASATVDYLTVNFDGGSSYDLDGDIMDYSWDFGDGGTGDGPTPSHLYSDEGTYTVTLTVTDNDDLTGSDVLTVKVTRRRIVIPGRPNTEPIANAGPSQKAWVEDIVYFDGSKSKDPDGTIISYEWDFGDGTPSASGVAVEHEYSEPSQYTVTLTVRDNRWAEDSDTCKVKISEPKPFSAKFAERVQGGKKNHVVEAFEEANTTVTLNTTEPVTVTVLKYEDNPHPGDPIPAMALPNYVDVEVSDPDAVIWPIYVEIFYTDEEVEGLDEHSLGVYYWFNGTWQRCSDTGVDTVRNVVWAYMTVEEASGSPILMGGMPVIIVAPLPPFLSDLTITPDEVERGDNVTIGLDIMNPNDRPITYIVTMQIGELTLLVDVELEAYESKTVSRTITPDVVGGYNVTVDGLMGSFTVKEPELEPEPEPEPEPPKPAEFVVSDLEVDPDRVAVGEVVTITVEVENVGEKEGTHTVLLEVDGLVTELAEVTLDGGESTTVTFTITEAAGDHTVGVEDLTGDFTVTAPISPGYVAGILIVVIAAAVLMYAVWKGYLPSTSSFDIDDEI